MEQIKELLNILKETPQMALWGIGMYFIFILVKMASWVTALAFVVKLFITRLFDYLDNDNRRIEAYFNNNKADMVDKSELYELLDALKYGSIYIHSSDIRHAIRVIKDSRTK